METPSTPQAGHEDPTRSPGTCPRGHRYLDLDAHRHLCDLPEHLPGPQADPAAGNTIGAPPPWFVTITGGDPRRKHLVLEDIIRDELDRHGPVDFLKTLQYALQQRNGPHDDLPAPASPDEWATQAYLNLAALIDGAPLTPHTDTLRAFLAQAPPALVQTACRVRQQAGLPAGLEDAIDAAYADGSIFSEANRDPAPPSAFDPDLLVTRRGDAVHYDQPIDVELLQRITTAQAQGIIHKFNPNGPNVTACGIMWTPDRGDAPRRGPLWAVVSCPACLEAKPQPDTSARAMLDDIEPDLPEIWAEVVRSGITVADYPELLHELVRQSVETLSQRIEQAGATGLGAPVIAVQVEWQVQR